MLSNIKSRTLVATVFISGSVGLLLSAKNVTHNVSHISFHNRFVEQDRYTQQQSGYKKLVDLARDKKSKDIHTELDKISQYNKDEKKKSRFLTKYSAPIWYDAKHLVKIAIQKDDPKTLKVLKKFNPDILDDEKLILKAINYNSVKLVRYFNDIQEELHSHKVDYVKLLSPYGSHYYWYIINDNRYDVFCYLVSKDKNIFKSEYIKSFHLRSPKVTKYLIDNNLLNTHNLDDDLFCDLRLSHMTPIFFELLEEGSKLYKQLPLEKQRDIFKRFIFSVMNNYTLSCKNIKTKIIFDAIVDNAGGKTFLNNFNWFCSTDANCAYILSLYLNKGFDPLISNDKGENLLFTLQLQRLSEVENLRNLANECLQVLYDAGYTEKDTKLNKDNLNPTEEHQQQVSNSDSCIVSPVGMVGDEPLDCGDSFPRGYESDEPIF